MSGYTNILVETIGEVGLVRLNRPEVRNALNRALLTELMDALCGFDQDQHLWEKKLRDKGGKYVYTQDGLKLVSAEHPDLPFTIDNKPVELRSFTESVLAEAKMLRVKHDAPTAQGPVPTPMPVNKPIAPAAKTQTSKALADFKAGSSLV